MNGVTSTLNSIFAKDGLRGMLEGKDYRNLDKLFPFIGGYMDRWTGDDEDTTLTRLNTIYSDIVVVHGGRGTETNTQTEVRVRPPDWLVAEDGW